MSFLRSAAGATLLLASVSGAIAQLGPEMSKAVDMSCPKDAGRKEFGKPQVQSLFASMGVSPGKVEAAAARLDGHCKRCLTHELTQRLGASGLATFEKAMNPATEKEVDQQTGNRLVQEFAAAGVFCTMSLGKEIENETRALFNRH